MSFPTIIVQFTRVTSVSGFGSVFVTFVGGPSNFTGKLELVGEVGSLWPGLRGDEKLGDVGDEGEPV